MIQTNRLQLKVIPSKPNQQTLEKHIKWLNSPSIMKWRNNKFFYNIEQLEKWYDVESNNSKNIHFQIYKIDTGLLRDHTHIGMISLQRIDLINSNAEIAFYIGEEIEHGKGYITEAIEALVDYGFNKLGLHRIYGGTPNPAAIRAFEKAGFSKEGEQVEAFKMDKTFINHCNYYILNT